MMESITKRVKKPISDEELKNLKYLTNKALSKVGSENYRQKLAFNLLNTVKADDQNEFFWILLRALSSRKDDGNIKNLSSELQRIYPLTPVDFEKVAYSIIMGIIASESEFGGE
ncbi:MAG: hypothetical protein ACOC80_06825 [Petrotogales bacterium]